jgi:hypothetical protein
MLDGIFLFMFVVFLTNVIPTSSYMTLKDAIKWSLHFCSSDEVGSDNIQSASEDQDGQNLQIIHTLYPINMSPDDAEQIIQACGIQQGLFDNVWKSNSF